MNIRNLGLCPCPRCVIPMDRVPNMGRPRDMKQRKTLARIDDITWRNRITAAREIIYKKNKAVNASAVERLLLEHSVVPSMVQCLFLKGY